MKGFLHLKPVTQTFSGFFIFLGKLRAHQWFRDGAEIPNRRGMPCFWGLCAMNDLNKCFASCIILFDTSFNTTIMPTVTLRVSQDSLHKLYELLDQLPEVEILKGETDFNADKAYLKEALDTMLDDSNRVVSLEELQRNMEEVISRHEN
ncbi:hypothetical protein [Cyclonatronum proteinivorum]|nr:hypothetical protein [Cyclonatronum proteinivorum]